MQFAFASTFLDVDEDGPAGPGSALLWTKGVALTVDGTGVGFGCIKASIEPFFIFWILSLLALDFSDVPAWA